MAFDSEIRVRDREVSREIKWLKWGNLRVEHNIKVYYSFYSPLNTHTKLLLLHVPISLQPSQY